MSKERFTPPPENGDKIESPEDSIRLTQLKQELLDPRIISKKYDQEGRVEAASELRTARPEWHSVNTQLAEKEGEVSEMREKASSLDIEKEEKARELEERLQGMFAKLRTYRLRKDIGSLDTEITTLADEIEQVWHELNQLDLKETRE